MYNHQYMEDVLTRTFAAQDTLNSRLRPDWAYQGYHYYRAAWTELAEAVQHMNWMWWKAGKYGTPETVEQMNDVHIELCDVLHFGLSMDLMDAKKGAHTVDATAVATAHKVGLYKVWFSTTADTNRVAEELFYDYLEEVVVKAITQKVFDIEAFSMACAAAGLTFPKLMVLYFGKATLNRFRWDHGYNLPKGDPNAYVKMWRLPEYAEKVEDNVYLSNMVNNLLKSTTPGDILQGIASGEFESRLYVRLQAEYARQR